MNPVHVDSSNVSARLEALVHENPIQTPGCIQPQGVLLVLDEETFDILQVSDNTETYLGVEPQDLLRRSLQDLLGETQARNLEKRLPKRAGQRSKTRLAIECQSRYVNFHAHLCRTEQALILELELVSTADDHRLTDVHRQVNEAIHQMKQATSLEDLLTIIVEEVERLTGFDRVLIYQFDHQGSGEVIAEVVRPPLLPYIGLHFPAQDIPKSSRDLYGLGVFRVVPDVQAPPVTIVPTLHPKTQQPLDLSLTLFRSVDPCCVEYYQNMGSAAMLVAPILQDQKLWGLISCHHRTPKPISPELRAACELLAQLAAAEIESKVRQDTLNKYTQIHHLQSSFLQAIAESDNFLDALVNPELRLLDLVNAQGVAVYFGDEITLVGETPSREQVQALMAWADAKIPDNLFHTNSLVAAFPDAATFKATASGLLLLRISRVQRYAILWFRPEVLKTVNWGGNPSDSVQVDATGQPKLSPRNSFANWQEIVRNTSLPWHPVEISSAIDLRNAIIGLVLKKADELAQLNRDLQRSNRELMSFTYAASHDLKEPLRGIYNYASVLLEDYASLLDAEGQEYLQDIASFCQRMELLLNGLLRVSRLRQAELQCQSVDLNGVVQEAVAILRASRPHKSFDLLVPQSLPQVQCDPILISEVFLNLFSNAIKYNDSLVPKIEIGFRTTQPEATQPSLTSTFTSETNVASHHLTVYVRDNGIGIAQHHLPLIFQLFKRLHPQESYEGGAGAGLAIVQQIIERHNSKIWAESILGEGSTFYFTL